LSLDVIGMGASGSAVGLFQLCKELLDAGVLERPAIERIREAIVADVTLTCPRTVERDDYQQMVRERLDVILALPGAMPAMTTAQPN
jgi:hypothetical protein